ILASWIEDVYRDRKRRPTARYANCSLQCLAAWCPRPVHSNQDPSVARALDLRLAAYLVDAILSVLRAPSHHDPIRIRRCRPWQKGRAAVEHVDEIPIPYEVVEFR